MIAGALSSLAVSMTAFTVLVLITFTAGRAKCFSLARSKIACNWSPLATPGLICVLIFLLVQIRLIEKEGLVERGERTQFRPLQPKYLWRSATRQAPSAGRLRALREAPERHEMEAPGGGPRAQRALANRQYLSFLYRSRRVLSAGIFNALIIIVHPGPLNPALAEAVKTRIEALHLAAPADRTPVPIKLVTTSAQRIALPVGTIPVAPWARAAETHLPAATKTEKMPIFPLRSRVHADQLRCLPRRQEAR
ncbi:exported hypothetical protein [Candidatus Accumulibacter aalborgensis]|uniref:Uncharacterized protein n=1 Tax=Candidatus Accumulibacter aalborgensis TaxID=1860102 RepID=A0A1A8XVU5_9PROT|nr:exported hypothetical protein [Candidatus Accumulibacter aalborgensis]